MAETHETITDIIAEIRALSNPISDGIIAINGRSIADRLEAAIRREKAAIEADALDVGGIVGAAHMREMSKNTSKNGADFGQLGDCAKLREALKAAKKYLDGYTVNILELRRTVDIALADPPRNCDRFRNAGEALEALERHCNSSGNGCMRCPLVGHSTEELNCKIRWLLAPAAGQEGGAK